MKLVTTTVIAVLVFTLAGCATAERVSSRIGGGDDDGGGDGAARGSFLRSDDYRDGEEVVGVLLTDEEYGMIVEDLTRNGAEVNWGWMDATSGNRSEPRDLAFSIADYETVRVPAVENRSMKVAPEIEEETREAFVEALGLLGLEVVDGDADLELDLAVVDYKSDQTFVWVTTLDPFVEIEGRLTDLRADKPLLLFRHQEHGGTPAAAAADTAGELVNLLR